MRKPARATDHVLGHTGAMSTEPSLRERRRDQTRHEIHEAALALGSEQSFAHVTVEAISLRAGVSPRTFFNYFPTKEAAVVLDPPVQLRGDLAERFAGGPPLPPRALLADLLQCLLEQIERDPPERSRAEGIFRIASENPSVFAALVGQLENVRMELAGVIATRLVEGTPRQVANLVASLAMAAVRSGLEEWSAESGHPSSPSPLPQVRQAVEIISDLTGETSL